MSEQDYSIKEIRSRLSILGDLRDQVAELEETRTEYLLDIERLEEEKKELEEFVSGRLNAIKERELELRRKERDLDVIVRRWKDKYESKGLGFRL